MTPTTHAILTGCVALAAAVMAMPLAIRLGRAWGVVDQPDARNGRRQAFPSTGGVAIAAAFGVGLAFAWGMSAGGGDPLPLDPAMLGGVGLTGATLLGIGLMDDVKGISARWKLAALLGVGLVVCASGVRIEQVVLPGLGRWELGWLAWPATLLWLTGVTVSIHFIDGLEGLASGSLAAGALVLGGIALAAGADGTALLTLALLGAVGGFLLFNVPPAKILLGNSGALFAGFTLAVLCVVTAEKTGANHALGLPALALGVPLADTAATLVRRKVLQRRSFFAAERGHLHHHLLDLGLTPRQTVLTIHGVTAVAAGTALGAFFGGVWALAAGLSVLMPMLVLLFHLSGSVRVRHTLRAFRENIGLIRRRAHHTRFFERLQLQFQTATTFDQWWQRVGEAGEALDFARIELPLVGRDGSCEERIWDRGDPLDDSASRMNASVPIPQRRQGEGTQMVAYVQLLVKGSLEATSHRLTLFTRLMSEHGPVELPVKPAPSEVPLSDSLSPAGQQEQEVPPDGHGPASDGHRLTAPDVASPHGNGHALPNGNGNGNGNGHGHGHTQPGGHGPVNGTRHNTLTEPRGPATGGEAPGEDSTSDAAGPRLNPALRVAVVHDFLYCYAGAERVLEQMLQVCPHADLFSLFDFLPDRERGFIQNRSATTTFIQHMPLARRKHRAYLPLMPLAIERLDLSAYDVVLSSSYLVAKGVITRPDQLHVCYCHTPVRFAWDLQHRYLEARGVSGLKALFAHSILHYLRLWDARSANGVDLFISNSNFVGQRVRKAYRRDSTTIYPPVDVDRFTLREAKEDFYLTVSRAVPYKRLDLIVEAFNAMPDRRLIVVGEGPELDRLRQRAGPNVRLVGHQPFERLRLYVQRARAFVFAAEEDFGIVAVEAQACGTPVIAFGRGGATESVAEGETGLFFRQQTPESVIDAVERFENRARQGGWRGEGWDPHTVRRNAERFAPSVFRERFAHAVTDAWHAFHGEQAGDRTPPDGVLMTPDPASPASTLSGTAR